jgi:hypothetical protein
LQIALVAIESGSAQLASRLLSPSPSNKNNNVQSAPQTKETRMKTFTPSIVSAPRSSAASGFMKFLEALLRSLSATAA